MQFLHATEPRHLAETSTRSCLCDVDEQAKGFDEEVVDALQDDREPATREKSRRRSGRPTKQETQERIDFATNLLQRRLCKRDIVKLMCRRWPNMPSSSIELYLRRAKELLPRRYKALAAKARQDSVLFWESIVRSMDVDIRLRCYARERLDRIFGVDGPPERDAGQPDSGGSGCEVLEVVVSSRAEAKEILDLAKSS